jgi:hypothetical protein
MKGEKLTDSDSRVVYDIGIHAADQALEALTRVLETAPSALHIAASVIADARLLWRMNAAIDAFTTNVDPKFAENIKKAQEIMEETDGPKYAAWAAAQAKKMGLTPHG